VVRADRCAEPRCGGPDTADNQRVGIAEVGRELGVEALERLPPSRPPTVGEGGAWDLATGISLLESFSGRGVSDLPLEAKHDQPRPPPPDIRCGRDAR